MCFLAFTAYELFLAGTCGPELVGFSPAVPAHAEDLVRGSDRNLFAALSSAADGDRLDLFAE